MMFILLATTAAAMADKTVAANVLAGGQQAGAQMFAGSQMVQRIAAPAIALQREAFGDVKEVQDTLMQEENHLNADVQDFERRMKTGNFPPPPAGMPSSFLEEGAPDSFADLDAKLKALEEKTKAELAKLQSDTAAPSSFVEEGAPDSFADLDAKLKALEEKTKAELAKLQSDTAAPSSFVEEGAPDSFADLDAKLKALEEKTKAELAKLQSDTAAPSSFVEEGAPDSFADIDAKLKALEEKTKAELAKLQSDTAAPSSFVEEGAPDSFADIDAKLKALEEKTKAELAKLQSDTAAPSSFVEESSEDGENGKAQARVKMDARELPFDIRPIKEEGLEIEQKILDAASNEGRLKEKIRTDAKLEDDKLEKASRKIDRRLSNAEDKFEKRMAQQLDRFEAKQEAFKKKEEDEQKEDLDEFKAAMAPNPAYETEHADGNGNINWEAKWKQEDPSSLVQVAERDPQHLRQGS